MLKEESGEERAFFDQGQLKVAMDSIHFHEADCVVWDNLEYVPGWREWMDWTIDVAVEMGEICDKTDSAVWFGNEKSRAAPICDPWYSL